MNSVIFCFSFVFLLISESLENRFIFTLRSIFVILFSTMPMYCIFCLAETMNIETSTRSKRHSHWWNQSNFYAKTSPNQNTRWQNDPDTITSNVFIFIYTINPVDLRIFDFEDYDYVHLPAYVINLIIIQCLESKYDWTFDFPIHLRLEGVLSDFYRHQPIFGHICDSFQSYFASKSCIKYAFQELYVG